MKLKTVCQPGTDPNVQDLIQVCEEKLPEFMRNALPDMKISLITKPQIDLEIPICKSSKSKVTTDKKWSIAVAPQDARFPTIYIYFGKDNDARSTYLFQRNLLSAILECGWRKKRLSKAVATAHCESGVEKYTTHTFFINELPRHLMSGESCESAAELSIKKRFLRHLEKEFAVSIPPTQKKKRS